MSDEFLNDCSAFLEYMGEAPSPKHSLDRIDVNGNYERGNMRWASPKEQANNRRNNHLITHNGKTQTVTQWAQEIGIHKSTLLRRLKIGDKAERLFRPVML